MIEPRTATAIHEAGHAVISHLVGRRIIHAALLDDSILSPNGHLLTLVRQSTYPWGQDNELGVIRCNKKNKKVVLDVDFRRATFANHTSLSGRLDGTTWLFTGELKSGSGSIHLRLTVKELSPTEFSWVLQRSTDGRDWAIAEEAKATKVK